MARVEQGQARLHGSRQAGEQIGEHETIIPASCIARLEGVTHAESKVRLVLKPSVIWRKRRMSQGCLYPSCAITLVVLHGS